MTKLDTLDTHWELRHRGTSPVKIDWDDHTASHNGECYFMSGIYQNGYILAWYSHSPWGRCTDGEKGWVIIDPESKTRIHRVESISMWTSMNNDIRRFKRDAVKLYGKIDYIKDDDGFRKWKLSDAEF